MLGEHIEPARTEGFAVPLAFVDRLLRSGGFEELEPVARYQQGPARLIETVIGASNTLQ